LKKFRTIFSSLERNEIQYLYCDPKQRFIAFVAKGFTVLDAQNYKEIFTQNNAIKEVCPIDDTYFGFAASGLFGIFSHPLATNLKDSNWSEYLQTVEKSSPGFWQIAINVRARAVAYNSSKETLYFGTNNGLFRLTKTEIKEIKSAGQSVYVSRIIVHENDLYVLSTRGNFYRIHANDDFELLNTKYKIPKFEIKILKQFGSNLIFSSNQDIHNIDLNTQAHFIYGIDIEPYEINDIRLDDKHLLILTDDGIIQTLGKTKSKNKESKPLFYINDFKIQGESKPTLEHIIVDYNENQASLNFSILDFGKTQTLPVYYQLNDNKWELISSETRTVNFPFLAHGTYRIRFKLGDEIQDQTLLFTILRPFWLRWWFVALVVLLALVAISTIIIYKRRKLFRKLALLEEKIQLEKNLSKSVLTSIKAQMNPHFFYNALNTIQAYIFTNDADNAGKYLSKFSKLTRRILEMSEAEFVNLSEEINTLKLYLELEEARFDDDFFFKIEVDENVDLDMMRIPPMLIQPYIENAIKHGLLHKSGEKHLRVSFEIREEILMISIDDNGIGRATSNQRNAIKNAKHKSFATEANAKRLEVLNQTGETSVTCEIIDKVDANNSALGTCVILRIPPHTDKNF
jgi:hypothetical protein